ncbi:hypothetical protein GCM10010116_22870 [Microbispora rosea subsp. aerata]|nr:hypothetical protein GCM10010116_22870 [Microbispora rosea subsp. aerata]GIH55784.1 hypothetical protein Mro02_26980 [Microbispora rosea subsp. aerata]GLJ85918.1 hypothetical protein GCM10017588_46510 [Microbispora rosea subsp. aerata]
MTLRRYHQSRYPLSHPQRWFGEGGEVSLQQIGGDYAPSDRFKKPRQNAITPAIVSRNAYGPPSSRHASGLGKLPPVGVANAAVERQC